MCFTRVRNDEHLNRSGHSFFLRPLGDVSRYKLWFMGPLKEIKKWLLGQSFFFSCEGGHFILAEVSESSSSLIDP